MAENNNWHEYRRLVISELDRLNKCIESIRESLLELSTNKVSTTEMNKHLDRVNDNLSSLGAGLSKLHSRVAGISPVIDSFNEISHKLDSLQKRVDLLANKSGEETLNWQSSKLTFWGIVVTAITSLVTSIISLIYQK